MGFFIKTYECYSCYENTIKEKQQILPIVLNFCHICGQIFGPIYPAKITKCESLSNTFNMNNDFTDIFFENLEKRLPIMKFVSIILTLYLILEVVMAFATIAAEIILAPFILLWSFFKLCIFRLLLNIKKEDRSQSKDLLREKYQQNLNNILLGQLSTYIFLIIACFLIVDMLDQVYN